MVTKTKALTREEEGAMLQQIWDELRYVRQKLDTHVDQNKEDFTRIKDDVASVKTELSGHKLKLGLMFSGIGIVMTGFVAWIVNHIDKIK